MAWASGEAKLPDLVRLAADIGLEEVKVVYLTAFDETMAQFFPFDPNRDFMDMWNDNCFQQYRAQVNDALRMDSPCRRCYQSSHCNWNQKSSFLQMGETFSPEWN